MTHEQLRNPFKDAQPTQETPTDEQVVGGVLGEEALRAMRELRGRAGRVSSVEAPADLQAVDIELTEAEQLTAREAEKTSREEMLEWAQMLGKDEAWLDRKFILHSDGRIEAVQGISLLTGLGISSIPPVLSQVEGLKKLHLMDNNISKFENVPPGLEDLFVDYNSISKLENVPEGLKELSLRHNPLAGIDGLPPPDRIGTIFFSKDQQVFADQAKALGYKITIW